MKLEIFFGNRDFERRCMSGHVKCTERVFRFSENVARLMFSFFDGGEGDGLMGDGRRSSFLRKLLSRLGKRMDVHSSDHNQSKYR